MARQIDESFEGAGYEESWTETNPSGLDADWPLEEDANGQVPPGSGSECLRVVMSGETTLHYATRTLSALQDLGNKRVFVKIDGFSIAGVADLDHVNISKVDNDSDFLVNALDIVYTAGVGYQLRLQYRSGTSNNNFSTAYTYATNTWYRVEYKHDKAGLAWAFYIYSLSGTLLHSNSGSLTTPRQTYKLRLGFPSALSKAVTADIQYDLAVLHTDSLPIGAEADHAFTVSNFAPTSDVMTEWTPSSASSHYTLLDEPTPNDDTDYIYTSQVNSLTEDYFKVSPTISSSSGKVLAVRLRVKAKGLPGGLGARLACKTGTSKYPSSGQRYIAHNADYDYYAWDWEYNPHTGAPWTWADIQGFDWGVQALADTDQGGRITWLQVQVIHGSHQHRYSNCSPVCGGLETDRMKVFARVARPPLVGSGSSYLRLRYSPNSDMSSSEYTSSVLVTSASDWTHIFPVTTYNSSALTANTLYYFDVQVSSDNSTWRSYHDDFGLSYYPSYKTHPTSGNASLCVWSDHHGASDVNIAKSIVANNPRTVICLGDWVTDHEGDLADIRAKSKSLCMLSEYVQQNIYHKLPFEKVWDDHDFFGNNSTKYSYDDGGTLYDITADGKASSFRGFLEWSPLHDLPAACRLTGTATGTTASKLIDSGKTFTVDNVHALATCGGAYIHNTTDDTWAMVTAIDSSHQLSLSADIMASGESYEILNGIFRKFTLGCAEIFLPDLRSQKDVGGYLAPPGYGILAVGPDMLDGVLTATPTTLNAAKDSGTISSVNGNAITQTGQNFLSTVSAGDVIKNTTASTWAQVVTVDSNEQLTLNTQIFSAGQSFYIYESGASHGTNAHGHIQRDWLTDALAASTTEWRVIGSSVNFSTHAPQENDQWASFDNYDATTKNLQRTYLNTQIQNNNDIFYLSSNRHYSGLDSGGDTDPTGNMWAELCTAEPGGAQLGDDIWNVGAQGREQGTATSVTNNTLSDSTKSWTPDELIGFVVTIPSGTGAYQARLITANTATQLSISPNWTTNPTGAAYQVNVPSFGFVELTPTVATLHAFRADGTEFSFSPLEVEATAVTASLPAYICGVYDNQVVQQLAYLAGFGALTAGQPAYAAGYGTLTGQQPAHVAGVLGLTVSQPAHVSGLGALETSQPAYINGEALSVLASKLAFMQGYGTMLASRAAYAAGFGRLTFEQPAFVHGALSALASQPAYINGGAGLNLTVSQAAFMAGFGRLVLSLPAFLQAGFVPGGLAFQLGQEQVVFPCGRLYPVREPRERLQVVSRTAGGTLRVQDKGLSTRTVYISVNKLPQETFEALLRWYDEVAVGALMTFTFYDESGAPRQAKWIGGFGLEWQGHNRYGGEIQLEVVS